MHAPITSKPILWFNNLGATYLNANRVFHAHTKHMEIDFHFIQKRVTQWFLQVQFTNWDQLADVFTKPLSITMFATLRNKLNMLP